MSFVKPLNLIRYLFTLLFAVGLWFSFSTLAQAANFSISPSGGTYNVGSTFDVSVLVDTKGQEINAVQMQLSFPSDQLQLVSPSTGSSIIEIYTAPPRFDNSAGRVEIIGGIPNGINVSSGLITKLTFRVKGVGSASLRFTGESQILLNDGRGTNVLEDTFGATYKLELPPQQGPIVISDTHPDQEKWYRNNDVNLRWDVGLGPAENYSYSISDNPTDIPDDSPETANTSITYRDVPNGINYFHIKAFRDGRWGGVSHYSLKIDNLSPAEFFIDITPNERTFVTRPIINFTTTDTLSGLGKYELKILPLKIEGRDKAIQDDQLFIEVDSPYQASELMPGSYEVIVRAYDNAGNLREVTQKLTVTTSWLWFLSQEGLVLPFGGSLSWVIVFSLLLLLLLLLLMIAYIMRRWYKLAHRKVEDNHLPEVIASQLAELQQYRQKYGKVASIFLAIIVSMQLFAFGDTVYAQTPVPTPIEESAPAEVLREGETPMVIEPNPALEQIPPVITSHSANIKDDELFYVSGRTTEPDTEVVVHLQSLVDGSAFDFTTVSDKRGDWTYRHSDFLAGGKYIIWAHTRTAGQLSNPSPQVQMDVKPVALNWGNSRITYQNLYIGLIVALFIALAALIVYIIVHAWLVRHRRRVLAENLRMAEDSIKRGFIALRRDIEAELMIIKQANLSAELAGEQRVREQQLQEDLKRIEQLVGQEVWQIETFENLPHQPST